MNKIDYLEQTIGDYVAQFYAHDYTPEMASVLRDSLSRGQLSSKLMCTKLYRQALQYSNLIPPADKLRICFLGHWHGMLPRLFYNSGLFDHADGIELDPFWVKFSNSLNHDWNWTSRVGDATNTNLFNYNVIVNTSCEHMTSEWIQTVNPDAILVLQSTDYIHPTHINTVSSVGELCAQYGDRTPIVTDTSKYDVYSRYSVVLA